MDSRKRMLPRGIYTHPVNNNADMENRLVTSVWDFGPTNPQSERKHTTDDPFGARMRPPLARALVLLYGKDPILDPMCGCGTTCIEASLAGFESYGIDIEEKNIELCKKQSPQIRGVRSLSRFMEVEDLPIKVPTFSQGDARDLPWSDDSIGAIVFSPPYWNAIGKSRTMRDEKGSPYIQRHGAGKTWLARNNPYGFTEGNIGNYRKYERYLEEMREVLRECKRVLEYGRFCVCVVKDLRRKGRRIPLGADICHLAMSEGFGLFDWVINNMYHMAHWQLHHAYASQIDQDIPLSLTTHEHILVFIKEEEDSGHSTKD